MMSSRASMASRGIPAGSAASLQQRSIRLHPLRLPPLWMTGWILVAFALFLAVPGVAAQDSLATPQISTEVPVTLQGEVPGTAPQEDVIDEAAATTDAAQEAEAIAEVEGDEEGSAGWWSIFPALMAIALALAFRQVVVALFAGVWVGAWIVTGSIWGLFTGLARTVDTYLLTALADGDHAAIIIFSLMIGGVVGIIQKNGGTAGIVGVVTRWAKTGRRGQLATAILGVAVFFDDYANTLIVGGTMRPITDRLRISREKLAYLVDSTAAPVASLALVTTWIGYEVGLIGDAIGQIEGYDEAAYSVFLNSIPYSFYPIFALVFVFAVTISRRDFGPMLKAERRARQTGQLFDPDSQVAAAEAESNALAPPEGKPQRWLNAAVPILTLVVIVLGGLYVTGRSALAEAGATAFPLDQVIREADSYPAMMWGSMIAVVVAVLLSVGQRILTINEAVEAWYAGVRSMLLAIIILLLAWALANVNDDLGTAPFLVTLLSDTLSPGLVPAIVFLLAAATAFATGSSWGTMGILMPLVIPLAWGVLDASGSHSLAEHSHIVYSTVSVVLAGAVWGDHCSPISDTTILSSLACSCDHIDHVRTQLPYAMVVGTVALLLGTLPTAYGFPWWIAMPVGAALLIGGLWFFGERVEERAPVEG
ncbi:MAG: Na+/H+ antiporter NhaC family protein [Rhodothermaceae bacterium]|nr:Na+/H+ antiporter NhaC family protein [Rhodothermaceae bacterium]